MHSRTTALCSWLPLSWLLAPGNKLTKLLAVLVIIVVIASIMEQLDACGKGGGKKDFGKKEMYFKDKHKKKKLKGVGRSPYDYYYESPPIVRQHRNRYMTMDNDYDYEPTVMRRRQPPPPPQEIIVRHEYERPDYDRIVDYRAQPHYRPYSGLPFRQQPIVERPSMRRDITRAVGDAFFKKVYGVYDRENHL